MSPNKQIFGDNRIALPLPPNTYSTQRRQLAALEYSRKAAAKDEAVGASQMAAAIHGGATWGMGDEYEVGNKAIVPFAGHSGMHICCARY